MPNLDSFFPFDAGDGALNNTEDNWRLLAQNWVADGVIAGTTNELNCFADSTGLQVKLNTGACSIRGHRGEIETLRIIPIAANSSGNPRIDRVVIRLDVVGNAIATQVLQGTPAASPTAPAITRSSTVWDIPVAQVAVANGAATIAAGNVTNERALVSSLFDGVVVSSVAARDLNLPSPPDGAVAIATGTNQRFVRVAGAWGADDANVQVFTTSGTWTKPVAGPGYSTARGVAYGPGGPGGAGGRGAALTARGGGGAGGRGAVVSFEIPLSELGATETVTIGTGGTPGAAQTANNSTGAAGVSGSNTSLGTKIVARAGGPGLGGSTSGPGGLGGADGETGVLPGVTGVGNGGTGGSGTGGGTPPSTGSRAGGGGGAIWVDNGVDTAQAGAVGGATAGLAPVAGGTTAPTAGTAGTPGAVSGLPGTGGGGGGAHASAAGGAGGVGGFPGGGGGGGAASVNGANSGAGAAGGAGFLIVICS